MRIVSDAGVSTIWLAGYFYGYWPKAVEHIAAWIDRIRKMGMAAHVINVPLGHPGDSLGAQDASFPLSPPRGWKLAMRPDGSRYSGTSLHEPATAENVKAVRALRAAGVRRVFLDDDFRLATGPGVIGGCFCEEHKRRFLDSGGYSESRWQELLDAVQRRDLTPLLRGWIEFTCDELTGSFRAMQTAAPDLDLGIMAMYLGAEKAGIRLADYAAATMRVGELMFDDKSFGTVKGKTDELFSVLFHRRFVSPERAYSETTAFPADKLSAANMAAKLVTSTIADVRSTMFMSGLTPFPAMHWDTLGPAMKKQAAIHERLAGHVPRGPFKHFWGERSRYVGEDRPFSLFLAMGVPFEVTASPAEDGWTFLSDADAVVAAGDPFVCRPTVPGPGHRVEETLQDLFAFRRKVLPRLDAVPFIEDEKPVVCAWYPTTRCALVWNLSETHETLSLKYGQARRTLALNSLDSVLVEGV